MTLKEIARLLLPPVALMAAGKLLRTGRLAVERLMPKEEARAQRPCHYHELFVRHNGDVYPCCRIWNRPDLKIGNVADPDLPEKIKNFSASCSCGEYRLRCSKEEEQPKYSLLNIELSLACQASCVMCCVGAPQWRGSYQLYSRLTELMAFCRPREILVQGGEVLVQKQSLEWIASMRELYRGDLRISVVSNGNAAADRAEAIAALFDRMTVSFVGFQEETYRAVMGLDVTRTRAFVERVARQPVSLYLKFLVTPVNLHEAALFLEWAATINPEKIEFALSSLDDYIKKESADRYWEKICERASARLKTAWIANRDALAASGTRVVFFEESARLYGIDRDFVGDNGLEQSYTLNLR